MHASTAENSSHQPIQDETKKPPLVHKCSLQIIGTISAISMFFQPLRPKNRKSSLCEILL